LATSSVTRLVDALEQRLGTPLLNRSTRSITLTDSGRTYLEHASQILADSVTHLVDEAIDVAIRIGSPPQQPNLIARKLAGHRRHIVASPAYLARHGTPHTPLELAGHNCMQFAYGASRHSWQLRGAQEQVEVEVSGSLTVNNSEMLRLAACQGMGLALLPAWLVQEDLDSGALVAVLPDHEANPGQMDIGIYAVYPASRRGSAKIRLLVDLLQAALSGVPAAVQ
jgi:DNA-binding transcriptional LysR family regulator